MEANITTTSSSSSSSPPSVEEQEGKGKDDLSKTIDDKSKKATVKQQVSNQKMEIAMDTTAAASTLLLPSSKTLKRCLSVPAIPPMLAGVKTSSMITRSSNTATNEAFALTRQRALNKEQMMNPKKLAAGEVCCNSMSVGIPRSNPASREVSPVPIFNIFGTRARRYSASYTPVGGLGINANSSRCVTPRISQLRQEECLDMNSREMNHEREMQCVLKMSQSWEDLTLASENWSCKSDDGLNGQLQVVLPAAVNSCSSPSPTSNRGALRLPYGLSPSPTRRTFATRRSMSPIQMRPSQLGAVKRKFELDDNNSGNNWNFYSQPPFKKIFTESSSRASSPNCQSPSSVCPSPDSGTYDGRCTPKLFISKLCTSNATSSSSCSSPLLASPINVDGNGISSTTSSVPNSRVAMCCEPSGGAPSSADEGISLTENYSDKTINSTVQSMTTDLQDETISMDDIKSETSSIGGCSIISVESSSCDSAIKSSFLNKLKENYDGCNFNSSGTSVANGTNGANGASVNSSSSLTHKHFFINKHGVSGTKKFIVNHDNLTTPANAVTNSAESCGNVVVSNAATTVTMTAGTTSDVSSSSTSTTYNQDIVMESVNDRT